MPIIETTKNHFLQQFEAHIDEVLTWDERTSHSAEPTLFAAARHLCFVHILLNAQEVTVVVRTCAGHDFHHYREGYVERNWQMYPIQARYFCYACYNIGFL